MIFVKLLSFHNYSPNADKLNIGKQWLYIGDFFLDCWLLARRSNVNELSAGESTLLLLVRLTLQCKFLKSYCRVVLSNEDQSMTKCESCLL